jgi:hypothetical protein
MLSSRPSLCKQRVHSAGACYTMPVTGCTDNSILTLEPFISMNERQIQWETPDGSCICVGTENDWDMPSTPTAIANAAIPPLLTMYLNSTSFRTYDDLFNESLHSNGKVSLLPPCDSTKIVIGTYLTCKTAYEL